MTLLRATRAILKAADLCATEPELWIIRVRSGSPDADLPAKSLHARAVSAYPMGLEPVAQGQIYTRLPALARSLEFRQHVGREANSDPVLGCIGSRAATHRPQLPELCRRQLIGIAIGGNTGVNCSFLSLGRTN